MIIIGFLLCYIKFGLVLHGRSWAGFVFFSPCCLYNTQDAGVRVATCCIWGRQTADTAYWFVGEFVYFHVGCICKVSVCG